MNWQDYIAIGLLHLALLFVAKRVIGALRGGAKPGCGSGCGTCGSNAAAKKPTELLAIGATPFKRK